MSIQFKVRKTNKQEPNIRDDVYFFGEFDPGSG